MYDTKLFKFILPVVLLQQSSPTSSEFQPKTSELRVVNISAYEDVAVTNITDESSENDTARTKIVVYDTTGIFSRTVPVSESFSNVEVQECSHIDSFYHKERMENVQILRSIKNPSLKILHCMWMYTIEITNCQEGNVTLLKDRKVHPVSREVCDIWLEGKPITLIITNPAGGRDLTTPNITAGPVQQQKVKTVIGQLNSDQTCAHGEDWHNYKNVAVTVKTTTLARRLEGMYSSRNIRLSNHKFIKKKKQQFIKSEGNFFVVGALPEEEDCDFYETVVTGPGELYTSTIPDYTLAIASILSQSGNPIITTVLESNMTICNRKAFAATQEGFAIVFYNESTGPVVTGGDKKLQRAELSDLDITNSKIDTLHINLGMSLQSDIYSTLRSICESERNSIKNHLSIISQSNGPAPGILKEDRGLELHQAGAATYAIFGVPMQAYMRNYSRCCEELPILLISEDKLVSGLKLYMDPRTKVIRKYCSRRICNPLLHHYYLVETEDGNDEYYCTKGSPEITKCDKDPTKIQVMSRSLETQLDKLSTEVVIQKYETSALRKHFQDSVASYASRAYRATSGLLIAQETPSAEPAIEPLEIMKDELVKGLYEGASPGTIVLTILSTLTLAAAAFIRRKVLKKAFCKRKSFRVDVAGSSNDTTRYPEGAACHPRWLTPGYAKVTLFKKSSKNSTNDPSSEGSTTYIREPSPTESTSEDEETPAKISLNLPRDEPIHINRRNEK